MARLRRPENDQKMEQSRHNHPKTRKGLAMALAPSGLLQGPSRLHRDEEVQRVRNAHPEDLEGTLCEEDLRRRQEDEGREEEIGGEERCGFGGDEAAIRKDEAGEGEERAG